MKRNVIKNFIKVMFIYIFIMIVTLCVTKVFAFSPSSPELINGIDVSEFQGNINFSQVRSSGVEIVYIRSSEGTNFIDPYFKQNYDNAKANGLKVGFYHYVTARNVEQAREEARFFVSVISNTSPDCKLAMDFEYFGWLNANQVNEISFAFLQEVESLSKKEVIVYSNVSNAINVFSTELANRYPLWIAEYGVNRPVPNGKWNEWLGFQYTDEGRINGIFSNVDKDYFTKEIFLSDSSTISKVDNRPTNDNLNNVIYTVRYGDTLGAIANRYGTTVANIARLNNISNPNLIYVGERLIIRSNININNTQQSNVSNVVYIVKSGDTLGAIANRYGTTISNLVRLNNIPNPNLIFVGERIVVSTHHGTDNHDTSHIMYTIRYGDTLSSIAYRYHTTVANLANLNKIVNPNLIYVGEKIRI